MYHSARNDHSRFYIGVEPNIRGLERISEKIYRSPKKGGTPNVLYVRSSVENLPEELDGIANQVFVLFPWGSLLAAVLLEPSPLRRICAPDAQLEVVFSLEFKKDRSELERLGIDSFSTESLERRLGQTYSAAGFEMDLQPLSDLSGTPTTWARQLRQNQERAFFKITAQPFSNR